MRSASSAFTCRPVIMISLARAGPDQPGQPLRAAAAGDDAEQDLGLAEHRPLRRHPVVAGQRQLAPAAEGVAGDGGDDEAGDVGHGRQGVVDGGGDARPLVGAAELADVGAGGEDPLAAGHHHGAGRVGRERLGVASQLADAAPPTGR